MNPENKNTSVRTAVETFIQEELSYGSDGHLDTDADLIEQGIIDSMSLLRLVTFLEEHYQIQVRDEDLIPANFRSLAAVEAFVKRSLGTVAGE